MDYIINQLFNLTAIPSPSGFTAKASEYVLNEFKSMGFEGSMTKRAGFSSPLEEKAIRLYFQLIWIRLERW